MMMSMQQRYLLDIIKRLGCVLRDQLYVLADKNLSRPEMKMGKRRVDAMLDQLDYGLSEISLDGNLVLYNKECRNMERLEAVDVMLELTEGRPLDFRVEQMGNIIFRFMLQSNDKLRMFGVVRYWDDRIHLFTGLPVRQKERILFLVDDEKLPTKLALPYTHYFALRQKDGSHRFFAGGDQ